MIHQTEIESPQPVAEARKLGGGCLSRLVRLFRSTGSAKVEPLSPLPPPPPKKERPPAPEWVKQWEEFMDRHPIGTEVEYLGIRMMVLDMYPCGYVESPTWGGEGWRQGELYCEYVDAAGHIQKKSFSSALALNALPNVKVMAHPLAGANVDRGVRVEIR